MRIAIIGGTGSLGSRLVEFYTTKGWEVTVFSRDPHKQMALSDKFPDASFVLADICDRDALIEACEDQEVVINAAALKIVPLAEDFVEEHVRVNILGAMNVIKVCREIGVPKVLFISSDKAVSPINLYGRSKAVGEDLSTSAGYSVLRYGNVVNSRGSFLDIWKRKVGNGERITLRTPDPTRFLLSINEAVNLVDNALKYMVGGEIFVPHSLVAFSIADAAEALEIEDYDTEPLIPGEKRHEILLGPDEQGQYESDKLCKIYKGYGGELDHNDFCSETVPRLTPEQFLQRVSDYWYD